MSECSARTADSGQNLGSTGTGSLSAMLGERRQPAYGACPQRGPREATGVRSAGRRLGRTEVFEAVGRDVVTTGSEDQPGYPRPVAGDEAHRAGLAAGIHDTVIEQVPSQLGASVAQCHHFGVWCGVPQLDDASGALANDVSFDDYDRAERSLAVVFQCVP